MAVGVLPFETIMRFGYDKRALLAQMILALIVIPLTYALIKPEDNIKWVYGADGVQTMFPPLIYLAFGAQGERFHFGVGDFNFKVKTP